MPTSSTTPHLSIIIPVYNEQDTLEHIVKLVLKSLQKLTLPSTRQTKLIPEIIVVNDGSTDKSIDILSRLAKHPLITVYHFPTNQGKGAALSHGLRHATGQTILIQDADLEYHPRFYQRLLTPLFTGQSSVVYGSRLSTLPLSWQTLSTIALPSHFVANKVLSALTNLLYNSNLSDMETGYKAFTKDTLSQLKLQSKGFEVEVEITAKILKQGISITEVPISTTPRTYQQGKKISYKDGLAALFHLIYYRLFTS